ncbi:hypothetical protein BDR26DRAFT_928598 [Obelidium mucronatum]|nr:hypothetical protein BDR26DRAFT_928598 [Obelidium mucronatum]
MASLAPGATPNTETAEWELRWPKQTDKTAIFYNKKHWDLSIDNTGKKVKCIPCNKALAAGRRPFQFDRLVDHCNSAEHIRLCKALDQKSTGIPSYFKPISKSSTSTVIEKSTVPTPPIASVVKKPDCGGVCCTLDPNLLDAFAIYGRVVAADELKMVKRPGRATFIVSACDDTGFREAKKLQCSKCKARNSSMKDRITSMSDVVRTLETMRQSTYSAEDIAFFQRQTNIRRDYLSEKRAALNEQVKAVLSYHKWATSMATELQSHGIEISRDGAVIGTDSFLRDFSAMYKKAPKLKDSLLFGLLHVCIQKARGHVNAKIPPIVTNFCSMMSTYGKGPLELISNNLPSISVSHLKAIQRKESSFCYLDLSQRSLDGRLAQFETKVLQAWAAAGVILSDKDKIHVTVCMDATKVVKALVYNSKYHCQVGRRYPNHMMPQSEFMQLNRPQFDDLADEMKAFVVMLNNPPPKMSPMFVLCGILQGKNDPSPTIWEAGKQALERSKRFSLGSVAVDGLDAPFCASGLLAFLNHDSSLIHVLDTHHGVKCARGQFMLGSAIKDCGCGVLDPGALQAGGVNSKLIKVADFASDALVLKLVSLKNVKLAHGAPGNPNNNHVNVIHMTMMRLNLLATDANGLERADRIAMKIAYLLWSDSIRGMAAKTKQNTILEVIGMIFNIADAVVLAVRYATTEGCEHTFGILRSIIKEFTGNDTIYLTAASERYITAALAGRLSTGRVGDKDGYLALLPDYLDSILAREKKRQATIASKKAALGESGRSPKRFRPNDDIGVEVVEESAKSRATQLWDFIQPIWNLVVSECVKIFDICEIPQSQRSPLAIHFQSVDELRQALIQLLPSSIPHDPSRPRCSPTNEICICGRSCIDSADRLSSPTNSAEDDAAEKERYVERLAKDLANVMEEMDEEDSTALQTLFEGLLNAPVPEDAAATVETTLEGSSPKTGNSFRNFLKQLPYQPGENFDRRAYLCSLAINLLAVIEQEHGIVKEVSDAPQQHGNIKQRFWDTPVPRFDGSIDTVGRGSVFHVGDVSYAVFGVFKLSYNKWRLEEKIAKTDNGIVHAMKVIPSGYAGVKIDFPKLDSNRKEREKHYLFIKVKEIKNWDQ